MAMLAEPRRKVRYIVNPTGEDWAQAAAAASGGHFGQRMLKSMGWTEGRGLGKDCQGAPEPIRVRQKNDQRGVGCTSAYAAKSMPQSVDFASLLSQLNAAHACGGSGHPQEDAGADAAPKTAPAPLGLEAKSRSSRARLHYHRFTRGKDVSAYDSQSLACIFGKKELTTDDEDEKQLDCHQPVGLGFRQDERRCQSQSDLQATPEAKAQEAANHGLQLVRSQTSLQDYFKAKMQARLQQQQQGQPPAALENESSWTSESSCSVASSLSAADAVAPVSGRKRVRFSVAPADEEQGVPDSDPAPVIDFDLFPGCQLQRILGYPLY